MREKQLTVFNSQIHTVDIHGGRIFFFFFYFWVKCFNRIRTFYLHVINPLVWMFVLLKVVANRN